MEHDWQMTGPFSNLCLVHICCSSSYPVLIEHFRSFGWIFLWFYQAFSGCKVYWPNSLWYYLGFSSAVFPDLVLFWVFDSLTLRCAWTGDSRNFLTVQVGSVALHLLEILKPMFFKCLHWTVVKHISFHLGVLYSSIAQLVQSVLFLFLT